jgi:hypothetical protein
MPVPLIVRRIQELEGHMRTQFANQERQRNLLKAEVNYGWGEFRECLRAVAKFIFSSVLASVIAIRFFSGMAVSFLSSISARHYRKHARTINTPRRLEDRRDSVVGWLVRRCSLRRDRGQKLVGRCSMLGNKAKLACLTVLMETFGVMKEFTRAWKGPGDV